MELKINGQARGTRIICGKEAKFRRTLLNDLINRAEANGFSEIILPSVEPSRTYTDKAGQEILGQMYTFPDKKGRDLCLRPEVTATIQLIADKYWKQEGEVKVWYFEKCWRYERPQRGRYREFWQFGCEVINPMNPDGVRDDLVDLAEEMVGTITNEFFTDYSVKRGLDYYTENGFEITCPKLGAQQQVCGGGAYRGGVGFAIGFDRLALLKDSLPEN